MNKFLSSFLTGLVCLLLIPTTALADVELRYSPSSPLTLGKNGIPALPQQSFEECINHQGIQIDSLLTTGDGGSPTSVDRLVISSDFSNDFEKIIYDLDIETRGELGGSFGDLSLIHI